METNSNHSMPVFRTVSSYREWRQRAREEGKSVGFVPTMGALHEGHLSLVRESLNHNDLTVISIFVNPAQFAPGEDLDKYPATFERDLEVLSGLSVTVPSSSHKSSDPSSSSSPQQSSTSNPPITEAAAAAASSPSHAPAAPSTPTPSSSITRFPSAIFAPTTTEMYPSGITLDRSTQRGTFIEVQGYSHQLEGKTRPHFFRGVCSVVVRLFNVVEPTNAYFGQKDIQQALLLRHLVRDLLLTHPHPSNVHIIPTTREEDGLARSSRNVYLSEKERLWSVSLWRGLERGRGVWDEWVRERSGARSVSGSVSLSAPSTSALDGVVDGSVSGIGIGIGTGNWGGETTNVDESIHQITTRIERAAHLELSKNRLMAAMNGVKIEVDYLSFVDADTFEHPVPLSPGIPLSTSMSTSPLNNGIEGEVQPRTGTMKGERAGKGGKAYLLCGAMKVGSTRLIDNIVLGNVGSIIY